jgi:poly-gamma-glutamate capsule biosynthesis protein CapA/YwtB (metallophosphatase superfamily)
VLRSFLSLGLCSLALLAGTAASAGARSDALVVSSALPRWLAPGAKLAVDGSAEPQQQVQLQQDGRVVAAAVADEAGEFSISARLSALGAHQLSLVADAETLPLGRLTVRPVRIAAVGDVTPGEAVGPTVASFGAAYPWRSVGRALRQADITTANLEGAISHRGTPVADKQFHFQGPLAFLVGMRLQAGMDVVTLANNHTLDYGAVALYDTLAAAKKTGISTVGAGRNTGAARRPAYVVAGGLRFAFLGYSDVNPAGFVATASSAGTARALTGAIEADVRAARRHADVVVCWFHWGEEKVREPNRNQIAFAEAALRGGARLVLGAHPHVFGRIIRPTSTTLVAWTLGNFVFPAGSPETRRTGILISSLGANGVSGYRLIPATSGVQPQLGAN